MAIIVTVSGSFLGIEPLGSGKGNVSTEYRNNYGRPYVPSLTAIVTALAIVVALLPGSANAASKYASIVIDDNNGRVLYSRSADARRYPASLTKIMTLYMVFAELKAGNLELDTRLRVSKFAASKPPSKLALKPGQTIRVVDAIRALVTKSANDIAAVIAEHIGRSEAGFARMMTLTAHEIGMSRTTFRNASGLPNKAQVTTARDMATLSRRIMRDFPKYYGFFRLKYFTYKGKKYRNHNGLLFTYKGTDGVKTGYTRASGFNLAASVVRGNKHLVAVVMGGKTSKARNQHMQSLLNKSWSRASTQKRAPFRKPARAPSRVPLPERNPLVGYDVPVASHTQPAPARPYAVASAFAPVDGISVDKREVQEVLRGALPAQGSAPDSGFHVQVGAYSSQVEAVRRLNDVKARAQNVLAGHDPITMPLPSRKRYLFRARFAGFSEAKARTTCGELKRQRIPCIVMRAE